MRYPAYSSYDRLQSAIEDFRYELNKTDAEEESLRKRLSLRKTLSDLEMQMREMYEMESNR